MKNKICRYCGADVTRTVPNCPVCGKSIDETRKIGNDRSNKSVKNIKSNNKAILSIIIVIFVFSLMVVGIVISFVVGFINSEGKPYKAINDQHQYKVGELFESKIVKIEYVSYEPNFMTREENDNIQENYKLVQYQFSIYNSLSVNIDKNDFNFICKSDGKEVERFVDTEEYSLPSTIAPSSAMSLTIYCEVPIDSNNNKVEYIPYSDKDIYEFIGE
jgi:predicted nucleic acid-binding Zn ribbon protein